MLKSSCTFNFCVAHLSYFALSLFNFFFIALNALFMYYKNFYWVIVILIFMLIDPIPVTGGPSAVGCGK